MSDRRVGLEDVMVQPRVNDFGYEKTVELLIKINCQMSDIDQTVKMAAVFSPRNNKQKANNIKPNEPIKYCCNYNQTSECRFGSSCIYSHEKDANHTTREPRVKVAFSESPNSKQSNPINKSNRTPNNGENFRGGYQGKNPTVKLNKANALEENASLKVMNVNNEDDFETPTSFFEPFNLWGDIDKNRSSLAMKFSITTG